MFRNYLVTALRNLTRNWLYAAISILGLAVAFTAALLIAQFVRNEFSYDHWIPGYQKVYKITDVLDQPGQPPDGSDITQTLIAGQLKAVFPGAAAIARLMPDTPTERHRPGEAGVIDRAFAWADPDIFKVLPLPALAGDLKTALQQPDTVVITRGAARRYFGRDLPIGDTLEVEVTPPGQPGQVNPPAPVRHPMRVTAVLKDLPSNTNLATEVFASGRSAYSTLSIWDAAPPRLGNIATYTFVRLSSKATAEQLQRALDIAGRPEAKLFADFSNGAKYAFHAVPLSEAHLTPLGLTVVGAKPTGSPAVAYALAGVGALIVLVAAINFVTLLTARAARRGVEVGVRKAAGARRSDLMIQFIGEALIQVAFAALIAVGLAALLLGPFSAFTQRGLTLDFIHDPWLLPGVAGIALLVGLAAAVYPALVLSSFRPAAVLKGAVIQTSGSALARQALVVLQFAVLIGLIMATATLYRQTQFALARGIGADTKLIVTVSTPCDNAFPEQVRKLPGVAGAACSSFNALNTPNTKNIAPVQIGLRQVSFDLAPVDFGFFELYGVKPLAGRLFSPDHGQDGVLADLQTKAMPTVIINETGARTLGFSDPRAAIGRQMLWPRGGGPGPPPKPRPSEIIGVVPDLPVTVRSAADPMFYFVVPKKLNVLSIKMTGRDIPGTVRAIEATWKRTGNTQPIQERFLSQYRAIQYLDIIIQGATIAICAGLAILIACLGLFALSAFTTERRTKEIGIRKVMGATTFDVVKLLLWQFTIPVLWAIVIALPAGFLIMDHWLHGFAYHVDLTPWTFVFAAAAALAIAWFAVSFQTFMVARAKPIGALRYE
jgi:putative ABC transport system permease protein